MLISTILSNSSSLSRTSVLLLLSSPSLPPPAGPPSPLAQAMLALSGVDGVDRSDPAPPPPPPTGTIPLTSMAGDGGISIRRRPPELLDEAAVRPPAGPLVASRYPGGRGGRGYAVAGAGAAGGDSAPSSDMTEMAGAASRRFDGGRRGAWAGGRGAIVSCGSRSRCTGRERRRTERLRGAGLG